MDFLLHHLLRSSADRRPDAEALVDGDRRLTYGQAADEIERIAAGLREAGARRGDRIGVWMRPSAEQALSLLAIGRAGAVFVPIHHALFPAQVAHIVDDCAVSGLIADAHLAARASSAIEARTSLRFLVTDGEGRHPDLAVSLPRSSLRDLRNRPVAGREPGPESGSERDLAAILYTSGSTGRPKGIMLSHANLTAGAGIVSDYLALSDEDRLLAALPFSFDAGLNQWTTAIRQGAALVVFDFKIANEIAPVLIRERISGLAGVPTLWNLITRTRSFESQTFPDLRYITNTGGAVSGALLDRMRRTFPGAEVFLMYGLTEAFRSTYLPPAELVRRPTSIGKAIPDTEILVVDEAGRRCEPGEVGELVHHGPTVALGYWGNPDATEAVFRRHPFAPAAIRGQRVVYSGDLVKLDDEGFLYFVGRRDQLIKSAGFRISPTEIEAEVARCEGVREAAAIGVPDELLGQRICVVVVPLEGATLEAGGLLAACRERMPPYMVPHAFDFVDALPKTPNGKTDYEALRARRIDDPVGAD